MNNAPNAEEAFQVFSQHWKERNPHYRLDDPDVRERLMAMTSSAMLLLHECPEMFDDFYLGVAKAMDSVVPQKLKRKVEAYYEHTNKPMHDK